MSQLDTRSRLSVRLVCLTLRRLVAAGQHVNIHVDNFYTVKVRVSPRVLMLMHNFEPRLADLEPDRCTEQSRAASTLEVALFDRTKSLLISQYLEQLAPDVVSLTVGPAWCHGDAHFDGGCKMRYKPHMLLSQMPLLASLKVDGHLGMEIVTKLSRLRNLSIVMTGFLDPKLLNELGKAVRLNHLCFRPTAGRGRRGNGQTDVNDTVQTMQVLAGSNFSGLEALCISCHVSGVGAITLLTALKDLNLNFHGERSGSLLKVSRLTGLRRLQLVAEVVPKTLSDRDVHLYQGLSALTHLTALTLRWGFSWRWHPVPQSSDLSVLSHLKQLRTFSCDTLNSGLSFGEIDALPLELRFLRTATALTSLTLTVTCWVWLEMEEGSLGSFQRALARLPLLSEVHITTSSLSEPYPYIPCMHIQLYSPPLFIFSAAPNIRVLSLGVRCQQCDKGKQVYIERVRYLVDTQRTLDCIGALSSLRKLELGNSSSTVEFPGCGALLERLLPQGLTSLTLRVHSVTVTLMQTVARFTDLQELVIMADHVALNSFEKISSMTCLTSVRITGSMPASAASAMASNSSRLRAQILENARLFGVKGEVQLLGDGLCMPS